MADDFTVQVINKFVALTGRMAAAPEDYKQAMEWEATGMPVVIVLKTLETWTDKNKTQPWLRDAPLEWVKPWVLEAFYNWRRAIGPQYEKRLM